MRRLRPLSHSSIRNCSSFARLQLLMSRLRQKTEFSTLAFARRKFVCPREESNSHFILRTDLFYPLNYEGKLTFCQKLVDLRGVEPRPVPCHGTVLPLYYRPCFSCNQEFCKIYCKLSHCFFQTHFEETQVFKYAAVAQW